MSPESKSHWPLNPAVLGAHLSGAGPLGWGACYKIQPIAFLQRTFAIVIILPYGLTTGYMGLDYTMTPPLLPFLLWFLLSFFISLV